MTQVANSFQKSTSARLAAVQAVYQMRLNDQDAKSVVDEYRKYRLGQNLAETAEDYADGYEAVLPDGKVFSDIVIGVHANKKDLQEFISNALNNNKNDGGEVKVRLEPDMLINAILLCGACELLTRHDVDGPVIIADYLHVTDAFYDGSEKKLVNAVLDRLYKNLRDTA